MGEAQVIMDACEMMPQVWVASEVQWVRAKDAKKIFGVGRGMLNDWVAEGKVMARCADKAVFYRFADIERVMNGMRRWMPKVSGDCIPRSPAKAGQASWAEDSITTKDSGLMVSPRSPAKAGGND